MGLGCLCLSLSVPIWSLEMIKSNHDKKSLFNLVQRWKNWECYGNSVICSAQIPWFLLTRQPLLLIWNLKKSNDIVWCVEIFKSIRCSCLCLNDGRCGVFSSLYHKMCWYVMFWFFYNFCNIPLAETISSWIFLYYCVSSNIHFHCFLVQTVWSQS